MNDERTKTLKQLVRAVEKHKAAIALHRDALRELLEEIETVQESATNGVDYLEQAIEELSRYV